MGTRNLTAVVLDGEYKVAQYGQWDGYPDGQGITALEFVRDKMDKDEFIKQLHNCRYVTEVEAKEAYKDAGADDSGFVTMDVVAKFEKRFPLICRDHGAKILELIQENDQEHEIQDSIDFSSDRVSCEYSYVVDLDKNTFEAFDGGFDSSDRTPTASWALDELPTNDAFLKAMGEEDED